MRGQRLDFWRSNLAWSDQPRYAVADGKVVVKLVLRRDGQKVATFQVEGLQADVAGLTDKLARAITEAAGKL